MIAKIRRIDTPKGRCNICWKWGDLEMNSCELTAAVTAAANLLSGRLTVNELSLLGAVLTQLGDTLATIAAQRTLCDDEK